MNPFWKLVGLAGGSKAKKVSRFGLLAIIGDVLDKKMELIASGDEVPVAWSLTKWGGSL